MQPTGPTEQVPQIPGTHRVYFCSQPSTNISVVRVFIGLVLPFVPCQVTIERERWAKVMRSGQVAFHFGKTYIINYEICRDPGMSARLQPIQMFNMSLLL